MPLLYQHGRACQTCVPCQHLVSNIMPQSNLIADFSLARQWCDIWNRPNFVYYCWNYYFSIHIGKVWFLLLFSRRCWVCFATEEDEPAAEWVRPCHCRGTTKWVHQVCLQRWIDEKQAGSSTAKVFCPQCGAQYIIVFPPLGFLLQAVEDMDKFINKVCPFAAAGVLVGSLYWSSVTYGAVTVMQVLGHKEGLEVMEKADPLFLLVGLPTIPLALILGKMIHWEDHLLRMWRRHVSKMSALSYFLPRLASPVTGVPLREPAEPTPLSDPVSATRVLCGALIMPTIATLIGKVGFSFVHSSLHRALLVSRLSLCFCSWDINILVQYIPNQWISIIRSHFRSETKSYSVEHLC